MNENKRLQELHSYGIDYDLKERPFEDVVELASTICDAKIAVVYFFEKEELRFKAKYGTHLKRLDLNLSFCKLILNDHLPHLLIEDTTIHPLSKNNLHTEDNILFHFYVGIPLISPKGYVIGTLGVLDDHKKQLTDKQLHTLKLLGKRLVDYLNEKREMRKVDEQFEYEQQRIKKISNMSPSVVFQLEREIDGRTYFSFVNDAYFKLYDDLTNEHLYTDLRKALDIVHPDDVELLTKTMYESYNYNTNWSCIHRIIKPGNKIIWLSLHARIEKRKDGTATWYGSLQDITNIKQYEETLEQISFDISHVLRKPISTLLGLSSLINSEPNNLDLVKEYSKYIKTVSNELCEFTQVLNDTYSTKKQRFINNRSIGFKSA